MEGGGPCNVSATKVPAMVKKKGKNGLGTDQIWFSEVPGDKLTFDKLDHFLVGHGGHERAIHLSGRGADCQRCGKTETNMSGLAFANASHLYDSVPFLDPGLDRRAARSNILDQLNPLPADGEAEAQLVLLHDHTSLDETGTWERTN